MAHKSKVKERTPKSNDAQKRPRKKQKTPASFTHTLEAADLLQLLRQGQKPLRIDQILAICKVPRQQKKGILNLLQQLAKDGQVVRVHGGAWLAGNQMRTYVGRFSMQRHGIAFVDCDASHKSEKNQGFSIFIHPSQHGDAWHGDTVRAAVFPGKTKGKPEGRVIEVLERPTKELTVRVVEREKGLKGKRHAATTVLAKPADTRFPFMVRLDCSALPSLPPFNALILARPEAQLASDLWSASALTSFGREDDIDVQEQLVKLNHQTPTDFPYAVEEEAKNLPLAPSEQDREGREDMRHIPFVTIDGSTARDFDDAIHVSPLPKGGWCLRVAIADVTHYVRPRSALDTEARQRGNSWYFPRSVEPMLPKALSHELCSLQPHVDRLVMLAEMHIDAVGHVHASRFSSAVICSAARLTYDAVKELILDQHAEAREAFSKQEHGHAILSMLEEAEALARALVAKRQERGSLDFYLPEPEYIFDDHGCIADITIKKQHFAHQIIEECMIAANEAVSRFLENKGVPFLYRIHPEPDPERLQGLFSTLATTPLAPHIPPRPTAASLQSILTTAKGSAQEFFVGRLALRTMPQARYQPENIGHFGLASQSYCHFTSPIRRYADVIVHRALKHALGLNVGPIPTEKKLFMIGDQLNRCERASIEAEREIARRLGVLVLQGREGEIFDGTINGVSDLGIFVTLQHMPIEGMIRIRDLGDDYFAYDAHRQELMGALSGIRYTLGQPLRTRLVQAHLGRLEITLTLANETQNAHKKPSRKGAKNTPWQKPLHKGPKRFRRR